MATKWDTVAIPFVGGIDTKSDPKAAPPTRLVELENGVFTKRGSIRKRHGYDITAPKDATGAAVDGEVISSNGDSLYMLGAGRSYTYVGPTDSWADQGYYNRASVTTEDVEASTESRTVGDQAEVNGVGVRAWVADSGGIEATIYDTSSGAVIKSLSGGTVGGGTSPRCVVSGTFLNIVFAVGGSTDLMALPINTARPSETVDGDAVVIASDMHADAVFDAVESSDRKAALFAWYSTGADEVRWGRLLPGGTTQAKSGISTAGAVTVISVAASSVALIVAHAEATTVTATAVGEPNGRLTFRASDSESISGADKLSAIASATKFAVVVEAQTTDPELQVLGAWTGTDPLDPGASGYVADIIRHSHILSSGFSYDDNLYFWVGHESVNQLQNSAMLLEISPDGETETDTRLVAQVNYGTTVPRNTEPRLPGFSLDEAGRLSGILPTRKNVASTNDNQFLYASLTSVGVNLSDSAYVASWAGGALYAPGGIVWHLDGRAPVEAGFALFPEMEVEFGSVDPADHGGVSVATGAGNLADGTYGYKVFYEWTNTHGEIMRSSAIPFSVDVGGALATVTLTIPTLFHTHKTDTRDEVSIAVYRTAPGLSTYNRVSSTDPTSKTGDNRYVFNDRTADTVEFVDNLADATANEIDPTFGGVLDNIAPPSCSIIADTKRRLWMAGGSVSPNRVAYSKLRIDGRPVEFNDALTVELPDEGGPVTGLHSLNDSVVIFKRSQIYAVAGDGPNNLGFGDFQDAVQVSTDVGCIDNRSIVETPFGVMFQSEKGIYLIDQGLQVSYVGADAEAFNSQVISSAELVPDQNAAIFLSADGSTLWFDYLFGQWSTFTGHEGTSGTLWDGKYCYLRPSGEVLRQSADKYTDGFAPYALRAKTAPIRMDDLQNFWRVKRVYILGEHFSAHDLRMNVWFDREGAPRETVVWTTSDFVSDDTWGSQATWGDDDVWGSDINGRDYQMSYAPGRQKCQSVSLEFQEIPGARPGRSFELTEIALLWGQMRGLGRLGAARRK